MRIGPEFCPCSLSLPRPRVQQTDRCTTIGWFFLAGTRAVQADGSATINKPLRSQQHAIIDRCHVIDHKRHETIDRRPFLGHDPSPGACWGHDPSPRLNSMVHARLRVRFVVQILPHGRQRCSRGSQQTSETWVCRRTLVENLHDARAMVEDPGNIQGTDRSPGVGLRSMAESVPEP